MTAGGGGGRGFLGAGTGLDVSSTVCGSGKGFLGAVVPGLELAGSCEGVAPADSAAFAAATLAAAEGGGGGGRAGFVFGGCPAGETAVLDGVESLVLNNKTYFG